MVDAVFAWPGVCGKERKIENSVMKRFFIIGLLAMLGALQLGCLELQEDRGYNRGTNARFFEDQGERKRAKDLFLVTKVIDGDTFWIDDGSEKGVKVRPIGIDAPETRNAGNKMKGYYGQESKRYLVDLIEGKWVRLEYDVQKKDRYQRVLAYVYLENGTFLNAHLVEQGYAMVSTHPPNVKHVRLFVRLQQEARDKEKGIWGE